MRTLTIFKPIRFHFREHLFMKKNWMKCLQFLLFLDLHRLKLKIIDFQFDKSKLIWFHLYLVVLALKVRKLIVLVCYLEHLINYFSKAIKKRTIKGVKGCNFLQTNKMNFKEATAIIVPQNAHGEYKFWWVAATITRCLILVIVEGCKEGKKVTILTVQIQAHSISKIMVMGQAL